jgi:hypothetical protein
LPLLTSFGIGHVNKGSRFNRISSFRPDFYSENYSVKKSIRQSPFATDERVQTDNANKKQKSSNGCIRKQAPVNWRTMTDKVVTETFPWGKYFNAPKYTDCDTVLLSKSGPPHKHYFATAVQITERFSNGKTASYILVHGDTLNYYTFDSAQCKAPVKNGLFVLDVDEYGWALPFFRNDTLISWAFTGYKPFIPKKIKQTPVSETMHTTLHLPRYFYEDTKTGLACFPRINDFWYFVYELRQRLLCETPVTIHLLVRNPVNRAFFEISNYMDTIVFDPDFPSLNKPRHAAEISFRFVDRYNRCLAEKRQDSIINYYPSGAVALVFDMPHRSWLEHPEMIIGYYYVYSFDCHFWGNTITEFYENGQIARFLAPGRYSVYSETGKPIIEATCDSISLFRRDGSLFFAASKKRRTLFDSSGNAICSRKEDTLFAFINQQKDTLKRAFPWPDQCVFPKLYYPTYIYNSEDVDKMYEYFCRFESIFFGTEERISNWKKDDSLPEPERETFYFSIWLFMDYEDLFSTLGENVHCDYNISDSSYFGQTNCL